MTLVYIPVDFDPLQTLVPRVELGSTFTRSPDNELERHRTLPLHSQSRIILHECPHYQRILQGNPLCSPLLKTLYIWVHFSTNFIQAQPTECKSQHYLILVPRSKLCPAFTVHNGIQLHFRLTYNLVV